MEELMQRTFADGKDAVTVVGLDKDVIAPLGRTFRVRYAPVLVPQFAEDLLVGNEQLRLLFGYAQPLGKARHGGNR